MIDVNEFKDYLIYNENGEVLGIKPDAPQKAKIAVRSYIIQESDKERLKKVLESKE